MWLFKRIQICLLNFRFMVATPGTEPLYSQVIDMHRAVQQTGRAGVEYNSIKFPSCSCFRHTQDAMATKEGGRRPSIILHRS